MNNVLTSKNIIDEINVHDHGSFNPIHNRLVHSAHFEVANLQNQSVVLSTVIVGWNCLNYIKYNFINV